MGTRALNALNALFIFSCLSFPPASKREIDLVRTCILQHKKLAENEATGDTVTIIP